MHPKRKAVITTTALAFQLFITDNEFYPLPDFRNGRIYHYHQANGNNILPF